MAEATWEMPGWILKRLAVPKEEQSLCFWGCRSAYVQLRGNNWMGVGISV